MFDVRPGAVYAVEANQPPWAGTWGMCKVLAVDDGVLVVRGTTARFNRRPEEIDIPDDVIDTNCPGPAPCGHSGPSRRSSWLGGRIWWGSLR